MIARPPVAWIDNEVADCPGDVIDQKILDVPEVAVGSPDAIAANLPRAV
jgi:hypothetical protein